MCHRSEYIIHDHIYELGNLYFYCFLHIKRSVRVFVKNSILSSIFFLLSLSYFLSYLQIFTERNSNTLQIKHFYYLLPRYRPHFTLNYNI